jgi:2-polyprenyl-6-methoxyphenol hydroxylase-like FAD-dependent oxidoreductase
LALALSERKIPITVYESRPQDADSIPSGVILTPNGLRVLDRLGVLPRIQDRCYKAIYRIFKNREDETIRKTQISGESMYGYANHRIWRSWLLEGMKKMLAERSITIRYNAKFTGIISDSETGIDFKINDDSHHASLLIGMDGIYSTVRRYLAPEVKPQYTGTLGVIAHVKRSSVAWPYEDYELNATIQDTPGAVFFLPEDASAEEIMIGMQKQAPEFSREDLDRLQHDKSRLAEFYRERYDEWGPTARSIIDQVTLNKQSCFIWPFLKVPTLQRWYSDSGRIVMCGDAAHGYDPDGFKSPLSGTSADPSTLVISGYPQAVAKGSTKRWKISTLSVSS